MTKQRKFCFTAGLSWRDPGQLRQYSD